MQSRPATRIISFGAGGTSAEVWIGEARGRVSGTVYNTLVVRAAPPSIARRSPEPLPAAEDLRGRLHERVRIITALRAGSIVWLYSIGGADGSALLRYVAANPPASLEDGAVLLDQTAALARIDDSGPVAGLDDIVQQIFDHFYQTGTGELPIRVDLGRARPYLRSLRALVAFDHLALTRSQIERLSELLTDGAICVASSEPSHDKLLDLKIGGLPSADAVELFAAAAGIEADPATLTAQLGPLCEALDDHPLPLQILGALIAGGRLSLDVCNQALTAQPEPPSLSPLGRGVELALAVLRHEERALVGVLCVGEPDLDVEALAVVARQPAEQVAGIVDELVKLGLARVNNGRYAISSSELRAELTRQLNPTAERLVAAVYFGEAAARHSADPNWVELECHNLFRGIEAARDAQRPDLVQSLALVLHPSLVLSRRWDAWGQLIGWVGEAAEQLDDEELRAWALHEQGTRALLVGEPAFGMILLRRAMILRDHLHDPAALLTQHNLTIVGNEPEPAPQRRRPSPWAIIAMVGVLLFLFVGGGALVFASRTTTVVPPTSIALVDTATPLRLPTLAPTSMSTPTLTPQATQTPAPTHTIVPTNTPVPPSETIEPSVTATLTNTPAATRTPTVTPAPTLTRTPTLTALPTAAATAAVATPVPTAPATAQPTSTAQPEATAIPAPAEPATEQPLPSATAGSPAEPTLTPTEIPAPTATSTPEAAVPIPRPTRARP